MVLGLGDIGNSCVPNNALQRHPLHLFHIILVLGTQTR
jgi:hypothetical protein